MRLSDRAASLRPPRMALVVLFLVGALGADEVAAASDKGVTLYRDADFGGTHQTFTIDVPNLGLGEDSVSSLRVSAGCRVTLYRDAEFQGTAFTTTSDLPDLGQTPIGDDTVSSMKIDCRPPRRSERPDRADSPDRPVRPDRPDRPLRPARTDRLARGEGVRIYEHRDFQGDSELFSGADDDLGDNRIQEDTASSVQVAKGCQAQLFEDSRFQGTSVTITGDLADLASTPLGEDSLSSLNVVCRRPRTSRALLERGDGVMLFDNEHFLGRYELLTADDADLSDNLTGDDSVSSVRVAAGCRAVLYREPDFQGASYTVVVDLADLAGTPIGSDALSSIEVTCRGRSKD